VGCADHQHTGKREQPLTIAITTAGVGRTGIAFEQYDYAKRVQAGEVDDATFLPVLLEPPEGFDWRDPVGGGAGRGRASGDDAESAAG
jgi:phage terminase large subunit-like protein